MKARRFIILTIFFTYGFIFLSAQDSLQTKNKTVPSDSTILKNAFLYLRGVNRSIDYDKAYSYFLYLAKKNYNPVALNALGMMNKEGLGRDVNAKRAVMYFYLADKYGSNAGTCNFALALRKGYGIKRDDKAAYRLYWKAAHKGYARGYYGAGEMLYKGLGVRQSYDSAVVYFEKGAKKGDPNCNYMLGNCYLEGHGKKQDVTKSTEFFSKALAEGHPWVEDIIKGDVIDSVSKSKKKYKNISVPSSLYKKTNDSQLTSQTIQGFWNGTMTTFDWSGTEVEDQKEVSLDIVPRQDSIEVDWMEDGVQKYHFYAYKGDKSWHVYNLERGENDSLKTSPQVTQIKFRIEADEFGEKLAGNIRLISTLTNDPLKPVSFLLDKVGNTTDTAQVAQQNVTILSVTPNPFSNKLTVKVKLIEPDNVSVAIYDFSGNPSLKQSATAMEAGEHDITLNTGSLKEGYYVVYATGRNTAMSQVVIKSK